MPVDPRIQRILDGKLTTPTDLRFKPKRGHARPPGTGPIGETCGSCRHRAPTGCDKREWYCSRDGSHPVVLITAHEKACSLWQGRSRG